MTKELKRELSLSAQYFLMVFVALVAAFFLMLPDSRDGDVVLHINMKEAWLNVDPYVKSVLLIFSGLSVVRLLLAPLVYSTKKPLG